MFFSDTQSLCVDRYEMADLLGDGAIQSRLVGLATSCDMRVSPDLVCVDLDSPLYHSRTRRHHRHGWKGLRMRRARRNRACRLPNAAAIPSP